MWRWNSEEVVGRPFARRRHERQRGQVRRSRDPWAPGGLVRRCVDGVVLGLDVDTPGHSQIDHPNWMRPPWASASWRALLKQSRGWLPAEGRIGISRGRAPGAIVSQKRAMCGAVGSGG